MYHINFGIWGGVFAVPNEVVDFHINLCGWRALQVLLCLLRVARPMTPEELASELGITLTDSADAINYWVVAGVITAGEQTEHTRTEGIAPAAMQAPKAVTTPSTTPPEEPEASPKVLTERFARMTRQDVLECSQRDQVIGHLLQEAQDVLGRILSNRETETIVSLYYNYSLKPDILLMLLHYCKSIGKDSIAYIERLAVDWVNREINTHEGAEEELLHLTTQDQRKGEIQAMFAIHNRGISKREAEYYSTWADELKMSELMIKYAAERTLETHGKINFAYTNAILEAWHKKGFTRPEQAAQEERPGKPAQKGEEPVASYDLTKVDELLDFGSVWD